MENQNKNIWNSVVQPALRLGKRALIGTVGTIAGVALIALDAFLSNGAIGPFATIGLALIAAAWTYESTKKPASPKQENVQTLTRPESRLAQEQVHAPSL